MLAAIAPIIDGLDVASAGELGDGGLALKSARRDQLSPGRASATTNSTPRSAAGCDAQRRIGGEARRALSIGEEGGIAPAAGGTGQSRCRIARERGCGWGGAPSPFGVDAAGGGADPRRSSRAARDWRGLHIYAGSQALDPQAIIEAQQAATIDLADGAGEEGRNARPPLVNLGGGFGVPYFAGDTCRSMSKRSARRWARLMRRAAIRSAQNALSRSSLAAGWSAEAGVYLTRIVDRKDSKRRDVPRSPTAG